jgi:hypothetical protein
LGKTNLSPHRLYLFDSAAKAIAAASNIPQSTTGGGNSSQLTARKKTQKERSL